MTLFWAILIIITALIVVFGGMYLWVVKVLQPRYNKFMAEYKRFKGLIHYSVTAEDLKKIDLSPLTNLIMGDETAILTMRIKQELLTRIEERSRKGTLGDTSVLTTDLLIKEYGYTPTDPRAIRGAYKLYGKITVYFLESKKDPEHLVRVHLGLGVICTIPKKITTVQQLLCLVTSITEATEL